MKQLTYTSLAFILLLASALLQSCKPDEPDIRCPGAETNYINLSADELSKVPYSGTDTLYFLDKKGDTNIVVGQGKQYYYDTEPIFFHPECPNNRFNKYQAYKINYEPIKGNLSFEFEQKRKSGLINISRQNFKVFFFTEYMSVGLVNTTSPSYYIDSLIINGKKYGRINICVSRIKNTYNYDTTYKAYYNKSHGILYIKSEKENEEYSIINQ